MHTNYNYSIVIFYIPKKINSEKKLEEAKKKKGIALNWFGIIFILAGLVTFLPYKNIDDECLLGYKALCAITPISSLILIIIGIFFLYIRKYINKK